MEPPLLEISGLKLHFHTEQGLVCAVDGVDMYIEAGEIVGLVGESGSGKSVTALMTMGLTSPDQISGNIRFKGRELLKLRPKEWRDIRGKEIGMIFQEPMSSLNPLFTIGQQLQEAVLVHKKCTKKEALQLAKDMLAKVGIPRLELLSNYPHQLSGGMRQRVMIAMAMILNPRLIIADEPTTALDVTIQAQIIDLLLELNETLGTAIWMITHDLGVVAEMCPRIVVMYSGQVVEQADRHALFQQAQHPYTQGLLQSIPRLSQRKSRLYSIPGQVLSPLQKVVGCRFADRCAHVLSQCINESPPFKEVGFKHRSRCWLDVQEGADVAGSVIVSSQS